MFRPWGGYFGIHLGVYPRVGLGLGVYPRVEVWYTPMGIGVGVYRDTHPRGVDHYSTDFMESIESTKHVNSMDRHYSFNKNNPNAKALLYG